MAEEARQCSTCADPASHWCFCLFPLLPLCQFCMKKHSIRFPGQHLLAEIQSIPLQLHYDHWTTIHSRLRRCKRAEGCVDLSIVAIEECIQRVERQAHGSCLEAMIPALQDLEILREKLGRDLREGWDEVVPSLFAEDWSHCSDYARWMLSRQQDPESLFRWSTADSTSNNSMGLTYSLTIPEPFPADFTEGSLQENHMAEPVPQFSKSTTVALKHADILWLYDCCGQTWTRARLQPHGSVLSGCLLAIDIGSGEYCGAEGDSYYTAISHICVYSTNDFTHRYLRFQVARCFPGVYIAHQTVYLFGGVLPQGDTTAAAEMLSIPAQTASLLPPMSTPRRSFTPCGYQEEIYLCGGINTSLCEKFNMPTQRYFPISLLMPETSDVVACWQGEEMVIVTRHFLMRWSHTRPSSIIKHLEWCGLAGCSAVLPLGETLYFAAFGHANVINLSTAKRTSLSPLPS